MRDSDILAVGHKPTLYLATALLATAAAQLTGLQGVGGLGGIYNTKSMAARLPKVGSPFSRAAVLLIMWYAVHRISGSASARRSS